MKLIQVNIWSGRLEPQILGQIKEQAPDILCLQEAIDIKGGKSALFASLEEIKDAMGAEYSFMSPVFSFNYMQRTADFGNAIISKFPIKSTETIFTNKQYVKDYDFINQDSNMRNLQRAVIELPEYDLTVFNHHGYHIKQHKNGDTETMRQCGIIAEQVKQAGEHVILTGDFNLAPHSESLNQLNVLLDNLCIKNDLKTTRTELTHKTEVCDYIFTSKSLKVNSFSALDEIISDHKALVVTFN